MLEDINDGWTGGPTAPAGTSTPPHAQALHALVHRKAHVTDGVVSIELRPASVDVQFPTFTAGAHIDLHLPSGLIRSYSLHNAQEEIGRYEIGVLHDPKSRGGSGWVHSELQAGDMVHISRPRNNFALAEDAARSVFVSGGIGVTPLLSMVRRVRTLGRDSHFLYCARTSKQAPFLAELQQIAGPNLALQVHFSEDAGSTADIRNYLASFSPIDHFYCCGPSGMLDAFEEACESLGFPNIHMERFKAAAPTHTGAASSLGQSVVELAKSGRTLHVDKDTPLLPCLLQAGVDVPYSCEEGICGSCETAIISGEADHRDSVLSKSQKASNRAMMVCVSRCKSDRMVLDL